MATTTPPRDSEEVDELPALHADSSILNATDLMIWSDDETTTAQRNYPPNAHLNPRFYTNRRRSSAASSRRNSLSSSHSHHSHHSHHSGASCRVSAARAASQSNYVAQHLRRASIIESRKARLADRAAHVEQVRLRAAQVKAAPRTSNTEEKAAAAQQAREKYLAKVAATCAEEVNKAKRVAEEWKERKAAEEKRQRAEYEEKQIGAEKRREVLLRTPRKSRPASVSQAADLKKASEIEADSASASQEAAAKFIQRTWRNKRGRRRLQSFSDLSLSIENVRDSSFAEATERLADEALIAKTARVLHALGLHDDPTGDTTPVRTFLSAYMILGHPNEVFSKDGPQEQDLMEKAKLVLIGFETAVAQRTGSSSSTTPGGRPDGTLLETHAAYMAAFAMWKEADAIILIETMVDQFVALDVIWQSVKDDTRGEVASDYREGIRNNQIILLSKIKKLAGTDRANNLIKRAIRESRRDTARRLRQGDVRPRPLTGVDAVPSATPADMSGDERDEELPQGFETNDLSRVFSLIPPNRVVVHELLMDPRYRIEVSPQSDLRNALNREVCENMRRGIAQGQGTLWTVAVAENIRSRLLKLLQPSSSIHQVISEVLDTDHIRNQCQQGMFSYDRFFTFMADLLPRLCAPARDTEVQALAEAMKSSDDSTDAMIEKLFGLLHIIDVMSLDYTNYMLQQAAPTLIREGQEYEQRMFAQDLSAGTITLQRTKHWWRNASVNLVTEPTQSGDLPGQSPFHKVYLRGIVDIAMSPSPLRGTDIPESLSLDCERLRRIRTDMLRFIIVGGILLTAKNLLRRDVRAQWKPEAKRILDLVTREGASNIENDLPARILATIESAHPMPASSREHLASIVPRFWAEANAGRPFANPVLKLLFQRLRAHVFNRLAASSSAERVRVASTAGEGLAAIGLAEFVGGISACVEELSKVCAIDLASHGSWYRQVAEQVEGGGMDESGVEGSAAA